MNKRVFSGIIITAIMLVAFVLRHFNTVFFDIFIIATMIFAGAEMARALSNKFARPILPVILAFPVLAYVVYILGYKKLIPIDGLSLVLMLALLCFGVMMFLTLFVKKLKSTCVFSTSFALIYPICLLAFLLPINSELSLGYGVTPLALTYVISALSDTVAYAVGITVKGPKLAPKISPQKTVSGAIGGLLGGVIGSCGVLLLAMQFDFLGLTVLESLSTSQNFTHFIFIGLVGSVFTQAGDLTASLIKRSLEIKDFGTILPGHGGIMDRVDGLTFNAFFIYIYFIILGLLGITGA